MATIDDDGMIVRSEHRRDDSWLFTVCYTACFSEQDLGQRFDDAVTVGEAGSTPVEFTATGPKVFRKKRIVVRDGQFAVDVRAQVQLWRASA